MQSNTIKPQGPDRLGAGPGNCEGGNVIRPVGQQPPNKLHFLATFSAVNTYNVEGSQ